MEGVSAIVVVVVIPAAVHVQQSQVIIIIWEGQKTTISVYGYLHVFIPAQNLMNSTSFNAKWKVLLSLYISTFCMLKLTLKLILLRPAGSPPGGTAAIRIYGVPEVSASQTLKSSGTA